MEDVAATVEEVAAVATATGEEVVSEAVEASKAVALEAPASELSML